MAQPPNHCSQHNTGYSTCVGHRPPNSPTGGAVAYPVTGNTILQSYIDDLRSQIRAELSRWRQHSSYSSVNPDPDLAAGIGTGSLATNETMNLFFTKINEVDSVGTVGHPHRNAPFIVGSSPWYFPSGPNDDVIPALADISLSDGAFLKRDDLVSLLDQYNAIRQDCICNSDCSCNNVCACHNDCGCNYSDVRLKKEIQYC